jgi:hypothetical protein
MIRSISAALLLALVPTSAFAQEWLSNRSLSEGRGVRLGQSLVLHPGIGIEAGYDSNVFYGSPDDPDGTFSAGRLRVTPHFDLATRSPQRLQNGDGTAAAPNTTFRLGAAATYQEYLASEEVVTDQRSVGVDISARGEFLRRQTVSFSLSDVFGRTTEPGNEPVLANFNRIRNRADLALKIAPGGRTLEFGVGYGFLINFFEDESIRPVGNYYTHDLYATTRWKFFPKTALMFDAHFSPTTFYGAGTTHPSSFPIRVRGGINGLLTTRLTLLAMVGYGAAFYDRFDDFDSVIGQLELGYIIGPTANVKLGYSRDFYDSFLSNYYVEDRFYLEYSQMIGGRVLLGVRGGVGLFSYATWFDTGVGTPSDPTRNDLRATASLFGEYRATDWLGINLSIDYQGNFTDWTYSAGAGVDHGDYSKLQAYGGVRVFY